MAVGLIFNGFGYLPSSAIINGVPTDISYTTGILEVWSVRKGMTEFVKDSIVRHASGDYGEVSKEDKQINEEHPQSALSAYVLEGDLKIWVKSENGKIIVFLPEEY